MNKNMIFLAGLHRSGTSLLHEIVRSHPLVSGFTNTGVPEDEGQHLQTVFPTARAFGGPGRFAYDPGASMNETHSLANSDSARLLLEQWLPYYDASKPYFVEKSPPNLIRTRFLQHLFPESYFIAILRHPIAVSYASKSKHWCSEKDALELIKHSLHAYGLFYRDIPCLNRLFVLRYEDFVRSPQQVIDAIFHFLDLPTIPLSHDIRGKVNESYFRQWLKEKDELVDSIQAEELERALNNFGYSLRSADETISVPWIRSF